LPEGPGRTPLENWLRFLKGASVEELTMLTKENPYIAKAMCVLEELSADQRVRAEVEAREKLRWDYNSGIKNARMKGREEGREEAARKALGMNMPMDTIVKLTGLSTEAIVRLKLDSESQES
jgi:predicted transposase/invertase (TIGR01784 family)